MSTESDMARDLGRLEGAVEAMQRDLHAMRASLDALATIVQQSRGGLRMLTAIAGTGGLIGAAMTAAWHRIAGGAP